MAAHTRTYTPSPSRRLLTKPSYPSSGGAASVNKGREHKVRARVDYLRSPRESRGEISQSPSLYAVTFRTGLMTRTLRRLSRILALRPPPSVLCFAPSAVALILGFTNSTLMISRLPVQSFSVTHTKKVVPLSAEILFEMSRCLMTNLLQSQTAIVWRFFSLNSLM